MILATDIFLVGGVLVVLLFTYYNAYQHGKRVEVQKLIDRQRELIAAWDKFLAAKRARVCPACMGAGTVATDTAYGKKTFTKTCSNCNGGGRLVC